MISGGGLDGGLTVVSKEMVGLDSDFSGFSGFEVWTFVSSGFSTFSAFSEKPEVFGSAVVVVVRAAAKFAWSPGAPGPEFGGCFCGVGAELGFLDLTGTAAHSP